MKEIVFSNRRVTSRFKRMINGVITISDDIRTAGETSCEIVNISYDGIQVLFKNNDFLFTFLNCIDEKELKIKLEFEYDEEIYSFENSIKWVRINDIGERNFYVMSALTFNESKLTDLKEKKLDLLTSIYMENIYIGSPS
jgi:hypothetical protein